MDKRKLKKYLGTGLKIVAGIFGGLAVFFGISKLAGRNENNSGECNGSGGADYSNNTDNIAGSKSNVTGVQKVINVLGVVQAVSTSAVDVVKSVVAVMSSFASLCDSERYQGIMNQTGYQPQGFSEDGVNYPAGNYPWNNNRSFPQNTIIQVDRGGQGTYCVGRSSNIIEVW